MSDTRRPDLGQLLANILAPPPEGGPPYTHTFTAARCTDCEDSTNPECRDGLLYRDGGEELDYADVYVGRCSHACHQPKPSITLQQETR